jgi:hypothetical protein
LTNSPETAGLLISAQVLLMVFSSAVGGELGGPLYWQPLSDGGVNEPGVT